MKHSRLALEFIFSFLFLGILICTISSYIGYQQYKESIERQYNTTAYDIAAMVSRALDMDEIYWYYQIAKAVSHEEDKTNDISMILDSAEYKLISKKIIDIKEDMRANDIFLVYVNPEILLSYEEKKEWLPLTYIFDCFDRGEGPYQLGRQGAINPKFIEEAYQVITTGNRSSNYFISHSFHGYNTSALLPIPVGEEYLILCVEIPMLYIIESIRDYLNDAVIVSISIIIFVISLFMIYYYFVLIKPIKIMTKETGLFIENVDHQSHILKKIKLKNDIGYLAKSILQMEQDIITYIENIKKVTKEQEKLNAELEIATQIQMSMLPNLQEFNRGEEFSIAASMIPAKAVGGDFYDFFMVDETHLALVMADVSGKGIPAALFMVIGKTLIKEYTKVDVDPASIFTKVNQILCESNKEGLFITAFEGILNLSTGDFYYVNAGHEMPFISKKTNHFSPYSISPGFVLAGLEDTTYETGHIVLEIKDKLFLYTDGVPEATNQRNELFGMERLEQSLNKVQGQSPIQMIQAVQEEVDSFVEDAPQFDDITMLCLEFKRKKENLK